MKKNSQKLMKDVKKTACSDALLNLNEAFRSLINAGCYAEAGCVLSTMKEIVEYMDEDYGDEDDNNDDDDDDEDDDD
jgi:hypothetical protein